MQFINYFLKHWYQKNKYKVTSSDCLVRFHTSGQNLFCGFVPYLFPNEFTLTAAVYIGA